MTAVYLTAVCQYPLTKKIGDQSVVIMTTKQAEDISNRFSYMRDTINLIKSYLEQEKEKNIKIKTKFQDSIQNLQVDLRYEKGSTEWYKKEYYMMQSDLYKELRSVRVNMNILVVLSALLVSIVTIYTK